MALETELGASCVLGWHSINSATSSAIFPTPYTDTLENVFLNERVLTEPGLRVLGVVFLVVRLHVTCPAQENEGPEEGDAGPGLLSRDTLRTTWHLMGIWES